MTKAQEIAQAIVELTIEKTRQTNAGHTLGANQIQARIDTLNFELTRGS